MGISLTSALSALVALCVLTGSLASAQAQPEAEKTAQDPALTRYLKGEEHYAAGRYELAVEEFEAAFTLSGKAALHFNIANCQERAGNYEAAAESLEKFLASANPPEPELLRERVWHLKRRALERQEKLDSLIEKRVEERLEEIEAKKASTPEPPPREVVPSPEPTEEPPLPSLMPAYLTLGAGAAALASALVFAGLSQSAGSDAADRCVNGFCMQDAQGALDDEERYALAADISGVLGLAAMGAGGYLWYRTRDEREKIRLQATPLASPQTLGVLFRARF